MLCSRQGPLKTTFYVSCPEPGHPPDMVNCCGVWNVYPGQYCCRGVPGINIGVEKLTGIVIGVIALLLLVSYIWIKCCRSSNEPTSTESGVRLVVFTSARPNACTTMPHRNPSPTHYSAVYRPTDSAPKP